MASGITHVYAVQRDTLDGLYLFEDIDQAREYADRFGLDVGEEVLMNRSAGAQFLIDTHEEEETPETARRVSRAMNSDEQREDRWARLAANPRQAAALRTIEETRGVFNIARRDTALPHLLVHTRDGEQLAVWPSGVVHTIAAAS